MDNWDWRPRWYKPLKVVLIVAFCIGLVGSVYAYNFWFAYGRTLPRSADAAKGSIYPLGVPRVRLPRVRGSYTATYVPLTTHWIVVYQTLAERDRLDHWLSASAGMVYGAPLIGLWAYVVCLGMIRMGYDESDQDDGAKN